MTTGGTSAPVPHAVLPRQRHPAPLSISVISVTLISLLQPVPRLLQHCLHPDPEADHSHVCHSVTSNKPPSPEEGTWSRAGGPRSWDKRAGSRGSAARWYPRGISYCPLMQPCCFPASHGNLSGGREAAELA